jgi:uncharacterized membrane protein
MFIMAGRKWKCRAQTLIVPSYFPISFSSFWRAGFQELLGRVASNTFPLRGVS